MSMKSYTEFTGQISDKLGWFVKKSNLSKLNTTNLKAFAESGQISIKDFAKELHLSRPMLYQPAAPIDREIRLRLIHVTMISDLAFDLYGGDKKKTIEWVMHANQLFFGCSPFEMALAGKAESVLAKLNEWIGLDKSKS